MRWIAGLCSFCVVVAWLPAAAQEPARKTIWDISIGVSVDMQPPMVEYRSYACGSRGGPPRQELKGFSDFLRCAPEADGMREVVFEYDDELEFVARARNLDRLVSRYAGTTEHGHNVMPSVLIDASAIVRGVRLVTDARPDYRRGASEVDARKRADAYKLGGAMAARFDIDAASDCKSSPASEGESAVGSLFVKLDCAKTDVAKRRRYGLSVRFLRKPGQAGRDPRVPAQLTSGQFESSALLEIYEAH